MSHRPAFPQPAARNAARLELDSDGAWFHTPKLEPFIEALKSWFPYHARHWDPGMLAWRVTGAEHRNNCVGLFLTFFPNGEVKGRVNDD